MDPSVKVPCSIYIEGSDWYKSPMYRFFTGRKPTFLGSIIFKRQMQLMNETRAFQIDPKSITITCNASDGTYCNYCGYKHKANIPEQFTSPKDIINDSIKDAIKNECEKLDTHLPNPDSALVTCTTTPHIEFYLTQTKITVTVKTYDQTKSETVSYDDFVCWCMVPNDSQVAKKLDEVMEIYFKSVGIKTETMKGSEKSRDSSDTESYVDI
jgi:hypothetical protein